MSLLFLHHLIVCVTGVSTLAFGHYRITAAVHDTTPEVRGGEEMVVTAAEAATMSRPGHPAALYMPAGVDPVAEAREIRADRLANLNARLANAAAQIERQEQPDPNDRRLNCPLVIAIMEAVVAGHRPHAFDNDFDADEIDGLFETARVKFHDRGQPRDTVFEDMVVLVGSMREMKTAPPIDSDGEEEDPDGEILEDVEAF